LVVVCVGAALALAAWLPETGGSAGGHVGYVGCSNTVSAANGYTLAGGKRFWPPNPMFTQYGGGTLLAWADRTFGGWGTFEKELALYPDTSKIWVQVCVKSGDSAASLEQATPTVLSRLRQLAPGRAFYVSALNGYSDHVCSETGPNGPAVAASVRDWIVAQRLRGPNLPALSTQQVQSDGCHPNQAGALALGKALLAFFRP
jgi:hypothetical protein